MSDPRPSPEPLRHRGAEDALIARLTWGVAAITLVVIAAGANVTSSASGDAVPTWPWGWFTDDAAVAIEMSHRVVAGVLVAATLGLAVAAWRSHSKGLRILAFVAAGTVVAQAVLGGVRVLFPETALKVAHGVLGQVFFCVAAAAAAISSRWWHRTETRPLDDTGLSLLRTCGIALAALLVQVLLGALGRQDVIPREVHSIFALVPMLLAARVILIASSDVPRDVELFRGVTAELGFLTAAQLVLGIASYIVSSEEADPSKRGVFQLVALNLHVAVGSGMMGLVISALLRTVRLWGLPTDDRVAEARRLAEGGR